MDKTRKRGGDRGNQYTGRKSQKNESNFLPTPSASDTGKTVGVGQTKVQQARAVLQDEQLKLDVLGGNKSIHKAYQETQAKKANKANPGFDLYWFCMALKEIKAYPDEIAQWPLDMLVEVNIADLKNKFANLAREIMGRIKKDQPG